MFGLRDIIGGPFIAETQYRDAIFVNDGRIDLTIIVFPGGGSAVTADTGHGAIKPSIVIFQRGAKTSAGLHFAVAAGQVAIQIRDDRALKTKIAAIAGHPHSAEYLEVITAGKRVFFALQPPGCIQMQAADAVLIKARSVEKLRKDGCAAALCRIVEVFSDGVAAVGETVRMFVGF